MVNVEFKAGDFPDISLELNDVAREETLFALREQTATRLEYRMERLRIGLLKKAKLGGLSVGDIKCYRVLVLVKSVLREKMDSKQN